MKRIALFLLVVCAAGCGGEEPLTAQRAEQIIRGQIFLTEPVYAEVPQRVTWSEAAPKDAFDELSIRTLENLRDAGLVTLETESSEEGHSLVATPTAKGFSVLGKVPSARGPALRGRIAEKVFDRVSGFVRHPRQIDVGRAEIIWHYENPTPLYPLFETKREKALNAPFASIVSIHRNHGAWEVTTMVKKTGTE